MTLVVVSILNYQGTSATIACVKSLLGAGDAASAACPVQIFVTDNGSGDDEQLQLQKAFSGMGNVHLRSNEENLGFAAGHNRNLEIIFKYYRPDYVWILNNDCLVDEGALTALLRNARRQPKVGIWGASLLEQDGETIQCAGGCFYNAWVSSYQQYGQGRHRSQLGQMEAVEYDHIAGASMFFPVATLRKGLKPVPGLKTGNNEIEAQWLNESFFLYFEELDLVRRLKPGFGMGWCKGALIKHAGGASTGSSASQRTELAEYHSTLSALKFTRMYYPRRLWFMAPARYFNKCLLLVLRGDFRLIRALTRGYTAFWGRLR